MQHNRTSIYRQGILSVLTPIAVLASAGLQGCQPHKEIECTEGMTRQITVRFDWGETGNADPEGMSVYFFPLDNDQRIWCFDIAGRNGGIVEIPTGRYRMLAYNNDTHNISFAHTSRFDAFEALALPIPDNGPTDTRHKMPELLYAGSVDNIDVFGCGVRYTDLLKGKTIECCKSVITCHPVQRVCRYTVIIKKVTNRQRIKSISGELSGLGGGVRLAGGEVEPPPVCISFPVTVGTSSATGSLLGFGSLQGSDNLLTLNISLTDGTAMTASRNVTDQILNSPNPLDVMIIIDTLEIPDGETPQPPIGDGDIDVGIDGWNVVIIDISTDPFN